MKIFAASQVREIDRYTIVHEPIASIDLMERAAGRLMGWYVRHFHVDRRVVVFAGPGNNGGDGLALARLLAERQYRVLCCLLKTGPLSEDCAINRLRLLEQGLVELRELEGEEELPSIQSGDVVVDAIFGSGLSRPAEGIPARTIRHINQSKTTVVAVDIPSGLFGEDNRGNDPSAIVRATHTLSFQFPFRSFFFADNEDFVGNWRVLGIRLHPAVIRSTECGYRTLEPYRVACSLPPRHRHAHKGDQGHALVIAGNYGMMGAALMAGEACLRSGCGLVTLHVPRMGYPVVQGASPRPS
ncbi:MAG: NAD(P)H-hydrate epimerase [Bacteroidales bacterium]